MPAKHVLLLRGKTGREFDIEVSPSEIVGDSKILKFFEKMGGVRGKGFLALFNLGEI